jgi:hypothetical protein
MCLARQSLGEGGCLPADAGAGQSPPGNHIGLPLRIGYQSYTNMTSHSYKASLKSEFHIFKKLA